MSKRHVLITSMKDEGPFVLEFVAHHRVLGFDAHHIATNDCSDGTDALLDILAGHGVVTHTENRLRPGDSPQHRGYELIRRAHPIDKADWIMVLDADEFLMVDTGDGTVAALTALAGPEVDVITLNSMNFGTTRESSWRPGLVTEQFPDRLHLGHRRNGPVKSLSRGHGRWRGLHNHHPTGFTGPGDICHMRGNGESRTFPNDGKIWNHIRHFPPELVTHELAWYNHYPVKSIDSYMLRRKRGRGVSKMGAVAVDRHDEAYWTIFAKARDPDTRIQDRYGKRLHAEMRRLLDLPGVADAQADCERRYADNIAALAASDE